MQGFPYYYLVGVGVGNDNSVVDNAVSDAFCVGVIESADILIRTSPVADVFVINGVFDNGIIVNDATGVGMNQNKQEIMLNQTPHIWDALSHLSQISS